MNGLNNSNVIRWFCNGNTTNIDHQFRDAMTDKKKGISQEIYFQLP